jgi:hypothetical protein
MELSQEEKDRIIAEEKLRMQTRKEFFQENFGHGRWGGPWRGGWGGYGCHRHCGGGFFKVLLIALVVFAACHFWHNGCMNNPCYGYGAPAYQIQQQAPAAPSSNKK